MTDLDYSTPLGKRAVERLQSEQVIWVTTTGPDGTPQPNPVWFVWEDNSVIIYSVEGSGRAKAIRRNGHVSIHFNSDPHGNDVTIFSGTAELLSGYPNAAEHTAYQEKYGSSIIGIGMTAESYAAQYSDVIRVTPTRLRGF